MPAMKGPRGKSRKGARDGGRMPGRRVPPPAGTGKEAEFFSEVAQQGAEVVVTLIDGTIFSGTVQEHDRDQLILEDSSGPIVIRKSEIRYVAEE